MYLWVKFFIRNFSQQGLSFVYFWRNVYRSALIPRNLPCLEKFLVARLLEEITLKSIPQTKEKCDSLVLSRSYLWMVWRCHGIARVHRYYYCLEPTVRKGTWMRATSVTSLLNYKPHWKQNFKRYSTVDLFTDMNQHTC